MLAGAVAVALGIAAFAVVPGKYGGIGGDGEGGVLSGSAPPLSPEVAAAIARVAQPGDLVLRRGTGVWSELASAFSRHDGRFSHVGVIAAETDQVIHAIGDPLDGQGVVKREPLSDFLGRATDAGLYRLSLTPEQRASFVHEVDRHARAATPFDADFSLDTQDALYCTELVWHAVRSVTRRDMTPRKSRAMGRDYIGLDDLLLSDGVRAVAWADR